MNEISTDEAGVNYGYPNGTSIVRQQIADEQQRYMQALLYFVATDPSIPQPIQSKLNSLGLCKDEFTDNNGWPHQLYVREARRMVGAYVLTENDLELKTAISDSIGVGGFPVDDHFHSILRCTYAVCAEYHQGLGPQPYPIPYRILTPQATQATNLLVSVAVSASHVAYGSLRVEATYMIMGQAAGAAASLAIDEDSAVQEVNYGALSARLVNDQAVITPP